MATTYNYTNILVWDSFGGVVHVLRSGTVTATDADTGAVPASLKQNGVTVTTLTPNSQGQLNFQVDLPKIRLTSPNGLSVVVVAPQAVIDAVGAAVSNDTAVAGYVNNPASATRVAGDAVYSPLNVGGKKAARKDDLVVNARDYGVVGDGVTDDTAAMQAALNAAGVGGKVVIPRGAAFPSVVRCNSGLTMLAYQTIDGGSFHLGSYLAGTTKPSTAEITFPALTGAAVGISMGDCCRIENLLIRGPGSGVGTCTGVVNRSAGASGPSHSARFFNASIVEWATCVSLTNCYYGEFVGCEFALLGTGLALSGCNNVTLYNPRFLCRAVEAGGAGGVAIDTGTIAALSVFGGSIEDFGASGGIKYASSANINVYGVYFETFVTGAFGLRPSATTTAVTLNLSGCYVGLNNLNRWVYFDTANSVLESHGNRFTSTAGSSTTPIAYVLGTATTNDANVSGDSWQGAAVGNYADGASVGVAGLNVQWPTQVATHGVKAYRGRKQQMPASSTTTASIRLPHGAAPTTPEDGDMWSTTAGLFVRINGVTKTVTLT